MIKILKWTFFSTVSFLALVFTASLFIPVSTLSPQELEQQTINDFGAQWKTLEKNSGYYASNALFQDILGPHFKATDLKNKIIIDIGSGSGRIVNMIHNKQPQHIHAVEPAIGAFNSLKKNTSSFKDIITYHNTTGENFNIKGADYALSLGVIHHIPAPLPTMKNIHHSLKKGGKLIIWLYAYEGNELYLSIFQPLRRLTTKMNDSALHVLSKGLTVLLSGYIFACDYLPLPMRDYMLNHLKHFSWQNRYYTVFDQLNPAWAKYYKKAETLDLMQQAGFREISIYHRHGYSWTLVGTK